MIYTPENVPVGTEAYLNGIKFDTVYCAKVGADGWVEYSPGRPKVKKPEGDEIYTRKAYGNVWLITPSGEKIIK